MEGWASKFPESFKFLGESRYSASINTLPSFSSATASGTNIKRPELPYKLYNGITVARWTLSQGFKGHNEAAFVRPRAPDYANKIFRIRLWRRQNCSLLSLYGRLGLLGSRRRLISIRAFADYDRDGVPSTLGRANEPFGFSGASALLSEKLRLHFLLGCGLERLGGWDCVLLCAV